MDSRSGASTDGEASGDGERNETVLEQRWLDAGRVLMERDPESFASVLELSERFAMLACGPPDFSSESYIDP